MSRSKISLYISELDNAEIYQGDVSALFESVSDTNVFRQWRTLSTSGLQKTLQSLNKGTNFLEVSELELISGRLNCNLAILFYLLSRLKTNTPYNREGVDVDSYISDLVNNPYHNLVVVFLRQYPGFEQQVQGFIELFRFHIQHYLVTTKVKIFLMCYHKKANLDSRDRFQKLATHASESLITVIAMLDAVAEYETIRFG